MSDITITSENLSRFSARLQKALKKELGQDIPLHKAALLFANALGVDTIHHLQKKLSLPANTEGSSSNAKDMTSSSQKIIEHIQNYLLNPVDSNILGVGVHVSSRYVSINISAYESTQDKSSVIGGFGIFFGDAQSKLSISAIVKKLILGYELTDNDIEFIEKLCSLMELKDNALSNFIGDQLVKDLNMASEKNAYYEFESKNKELTPKYTSIPDYGFCQKLIAEVTADFFERVACSYTLSNDKYVEIDLTKEKSVVFYNEIETALAKQKKDSLLVEFLTPLHPYSNKASAVDKRKGISSYCIHYEKGHRHASTYNDSVNQEIKTEADFYVFTGKKAARQNSSLTTLLQSFPINHRYLKEIEEGYNSAV